MTTVVETLLTEHARGDHKVAHPDCPACKAAAQLRKGTFR